MKPTGNPEVLYPDDSSMVVVDAGTIAVLKSGALQTTRNRIRLCTHPDIGDRLHEMVIIHERGAYVRPHKHPGKSESFHIIEGQVDVVIFDDKGAVTRVLPMGDYSSGRPFYYRMAEPSFHTLLIRSAVLVFHETTNGPFDRGATIFADWAPEDADTQGVETFLASLNARVAAGGETSVSSAKAIQL